MFTVYRKTLLNFAGPFCKGYKLSVHGFLFQKEHSPFLFSFDKTNDSDWHWKVGWRSVQFLSQTKLKCMMGECESRVQCCMMAACRWEEFWQIRFYVLQRNWKILIVANAEFGTYRYQGPVIPKERTISSNLHSSVFIVVLCRHRAPSWFI